MKRALATAAVLLTLPLAGCGSDDDSSEEAAPAPSAAERSPSESSAPAAEVNLPSQAPELPKTAPTALAPSGASFDACTVVPPALLTEVFGTMAGQSMPQMSSFGDPAAADCYYFSSDTVVVAQATTRADEDMPESSYSYAGIPGSVEIPDADRGWGIILPGQEGADAIVSGLILVKDGKGLNFSISITGHPYDNDTLVEFANAVLEGM